MPHINFQWTYKFTPYNTCRKYCSTFLNLKLSLRNYLVMHFFTQLKHQKENCVFKLSLVIYVSLILVRHILHHTSLFILASPTPWIIFLLVSSFFFPVALLTFLVSIFVIIFERITILLLILILPTFPCSRISVHFFPTLSSHHLITL